MIDLSGIWSKIFTRPPLPKLALPMPAAPATPAATILPQTLAPPVNLSPPLVYPAKGFDCYAGTLTQAQLQAAKAAGYTFVMHYYGGSSGKDLTRASAIATSDLGMWCGAVFEEGGANFSGDQGVDDATKALAQAAQVGQPAGSAIYFAVDTGVNATADVLAYFGSIATLVRGAGYKVGAYGPGAVLKAALEAGTIDYDWLGGAMGWPGSRAYLNPAMSQGLPHNVPGMPQVDDDIAYRECGLFQVST